MADISEKLFSAYLEKGLSYIQLSKICKVPAATIQRYVMGETERIDIDKLQAICQVLDVDVAELLGWKEKQESEDQRLNAEIIHLLSGLSLHGKHQAIDYIQLLLMREGKK
jgi:transcriptional regulator with XRE-family HTH domain